MHKVISCVPYEYFDSPNGASDVDATVSESAVHSYEVLSAADRCSPLAEMHHCEYDGYLSQNAIVHYQAEDGEKFEGI